MSSSVRRQASQIKNYRDIPSWWMVLQVGAGIFFALFLGYKLIADEQPSVYDQALQSAPVAEQGPPTTGDGNSSGTSLTEAVDLQDGSTAVDVPSDALTVARSAAEAVFTTDFSTVTFATGAQAPTNLPQAFSSPQVADPVVATFQDGLITFVFAVDPDGEDGAESTRRINITVADDDGTWGYTGS